MSTKTTHAVLALSLHSFLAAPALAGDDRTPTTTDPEPALEEVVVEATRAGLTVLDIPVNASVLDRQVVQENSTKSVDEILRQIPGFSLLRAADSIATAPVTSTVSLRGLGGNAASRTLVLLDGVPLNSPYSSEVYWARIPKHQIERIEVIRGGGANAWGNLSLGGVINIVTEQPRKDGLDASASISDPFTVDLGAAASQITDRWSLSANASYFDTDGYMNLPADQRGPVDEEVRKDYGSVSGKASYRINDGTRLSFNGGWFREARHAGTPLDTDTTEIGSLGASLEVDTHDAGLWELRLFYDDMQANDYSVRVNNDHSGESIRSFREQPVWALGSGLTWSKSLAGGHRLTAGADYRWTGITVDEFRRYLDGVPRELKTVEGDQDLGGVFLADHWRLGTRWQLNGSLRYDYVTNNGSLTVSDIASGGIGDSETYAPHSETTLNPSLGAVFRASDRVSLRAAAYKGFRAPTLRELYRSASTRGGVNLVNNPTLAPERLVGIEAGADFTFGETATLRLTVFRNTVEDLIQNITRGETGSAPGVVEPCGLIGANETCRELDNVGEMEATGVELEASYAPDENWELYLSYLYNDSEITQAPDNPQLIGNQVRQAPKNAFTARARMLGRWFDTSLQARYVGPRYEDDLNRLRVDSFLLFNLRFSRRISATTEWFLNIENLFDEEYQVRVENNGSIEIGRPRFVSLGLSFRR